MSFWREILFLPLIGLLSPVLTSIAAEGPAREPERLRILSDGYPRAFFFRAAEGLAANERMPYDRWEATFSRLMGIEGKVLDEEVPGRSQRNIDFFTRFKRRYPDQLVLLHYNGNARDPRYQTEGRYFAGHWVYFNGARLLDDVPAEGGETDIRVSDPSLFRTNIGRYRDKHEDIGLCSLDERGRPDWHDSEQVQLLAVDPARRVIRVRRGCFGTAPRAFRAGASYGAAHAYEGPWGQRSNLMWFYNYSTRCPLDAQGKTCSDIHAAELAARFAGDGELAAFDGLEFDVLHHTCGGTTGQRGPDCDADGQPDGGVVDGVNEYGAGVIEFCRQLRDRLGEQTLVLADGHSAHGQRASGLLNGIESEGWPALSDWEIKDWSGGLNRHRFWSVNGRQPVFNYVNHKFTMAGELPGQRVTPEVPWGVHRLVFAAAMFTDSAICYSLTPPSERGEPIGIWDELVQGSEHKPGWLGQPLGPAVRLARQSADRLDGLGNPPRAELLAKIDGSGSECRLEGDAIQVTATEADGNSIRWRLQDVPSDGPDLFVAVTLRGSAEPAYPAEMPRIAWVGIAADGQLVRPEPPPAGMCLRGGTDTAIVDDSGAEVRWVPRQPLAGKTFPAYLVHPPYRDGTGYTYWVRDVTVPDGGRLEFATGMGEKAPARSDGVVFRVEIAETHSEPGADFASVFEHRQVESRWITHQVPLDAWAGKRVRLRFVSDCGPQDNATTDHSYWGDVVVVGGRGRAGLTAPTRYMTWVNQRDFESGFYFSDVRSEAVDLEFMVEGTQPVWLKAVTVHARPDTVYREFDKGLVLANPSPRPYEFHLDEFVGETSFRHLQGSALQDAARNNGRVVGKTVRVDSLEGLFLVRACGWRGRTADDQ